MTLADGSPDAAATRIAVLQMTSGITPLVNARTITDAAAQASNSGATALSMATASGGSGGVGRAAAGADDGAAGVTTDGGAGRAAGVSWLLLRPTAGAITALPTSASPQTGHVSKPRAACAA